jgi:hypothetical protein
MRVFYIVFVLLYFMLSLIVAQDSGGVNFDSTGGLESIFIETYAVHPVIRPNLNSEKCLSAGNITYRVYVDMAAGYKIQALYGIPAHPLHIETTGVFYNNQDYGGKCGDEINDFLINDDNLAFDSWLTLGAASQKHYGIPIEEDYDGSMLHYETFGKGDGLIEGRIPALRFFRFTPDFFQREDSSQLIVNDGAWLVYEGVQGIKSSNRVLILQLTTSGFLTLKLNIQLLSPKGEIEQYVYGNPIDKEIVSKNLEINHYNALGNQLLTLQFYP